MIKQISLDKPISQYFTTSINSENLDYLGRLKYGYALLAQYLEEPTGIQADYSVDRLLSSRDWSDMLNSWKGHSFYNHLDDLGNLVILDTYKVSKAYPEKQRVYVKTGIKELKKFLEDNPVEVSYDAMMKRTEHKKKLLIDFFQGKGTYGED